jgi:hypothetical protein
MRAPEESTSLLSHEDHYRSSIAHTGEEHSFLEDGSGFLRSFLMLATTVEYVEQK